MKKIFVSISSVALLLCFAVCLPSVAATTQKVYTVKISGDVSPGMAAFVRRALDDIPEGDNQTIIIEMDTFGGRVDSAFMIVDVNPSDNG